MENSKNHAINGVMAGLLALGYHIDLGIPSWVLTEMVTRKTCPLTPRDVLGISAAYRDGSIVSEYRNKVGYEFSWGTLSEDVRMDEDDETWIGKFEFFPKHVLMAFPQSALVEDLFMWMYQYHPLCHEQFDCDESYGDWFVLSFTAYGEEDISALRCWLAGVFVPKIMPDLVAEALRIVEAAKAEAIANSSDGSFEEALYEKGRYQLCGDPADLSFNLEK